MAYLTNPRGLMLVTDAMEAMGLAAGLYRLGAQTIEIIEEPISGRSKSSNRNGSSLSKERQNDLERDLLRDGLHRLTATGFRRKAVVYGSDTIAGSVADMPSCVRNFHNFTQCSLAFALEAASLHPAKFLGELGIE